VIRVGIVGYGYSGRILHAYLVSHVPDLELVAVASRAPERRRQAEQDYGVTTYETLDEMLERGNVELVIVATPHSTHATLACQIMDAGKHCIVDKAMCMNAGEADAMIAASRGNGVLLSVFQNRRWDWDYLTVRKAIDEGVIGPPFLYETALLGYRPQRGWRADQETSGGILFDWGAHFVDQALQLVPGEIASVGCDIQYRGWGKEIGSYARLLIRFAVDVLYSIELSNLSRHSKPRWLVLGELGALVKYGLDPQERAVRAGRIEAAVEDDANRASIRTEVHDLSTEMVVESVRGDWTDYYRNIADVLAGRAELIVTPEQARRVMVVLDAAMQSAAGGGTVRLNA
jgi:scyllo-inositol 2-dehydrogenase (NADP+)